jgi:hypothetical protein
VSLAQLAGTLHYICRGCSKALGYLTKNNNLITDSLTLYGYGREAMLMIFFLIWCVAAVPLCKNGEKYKFVAFMVSLDLSQHLIYFVHVLDLSIFWIGSSLVWDNFSLPMAFLWFLLVQVLRRLTLALQPHSTWNLK